MSKINLSSITDENTYNETEQVLKEIQEYTDNTSYLVEQKVNEIIYNNCKELDDYVEYIKSVLATDDTSFPTAILEDITLALPVLLYQIGDISERIGVKEDIAKAIKLEMYNNILTNETGKSTEKKIIADTNTQAEALAVIIYQRAYKYIKLKMDYGLELLQSVKKTLSKRITELEVSKSTK